MWAVAGALLGAFVVLTLLGALAGPHLHIGAVVAGAAAAVSLVVVALAASSPGLAWTLFGLDLGASGVIGVSAWRALRHREPHALGTHGTPTSALVGAEGMCISALNPEGVVRIRGEQWTAVSVNGPAPAGSRVQVVGVSGLRLEVWNEEAGVRGLPEQSWPRGSDGQERSS